MRPWSNPAEGASLAGANLHSWQWKLPSAPVAFAACSPHPCLVHVALHLVLKADRGCQTSPDVAGKFALKTHLAVGHTRQVFELQQQGSIIVSPTTCPSDNGASLLLQAHSYYWSLCCSSCSSFKAQQLTHHHPGPSRSSWSIPVVKSLSAVEIYELPKCASWRP